jgi:hypothetical protein
MGGLRAWVAQNLQDSVVEILEVQRALRLNKLAVPWLEVL